MSKVSLIFCALGIHLWRSNYGGTRHHIELRRCIRCKRLERVIHGPGTPVYEIIDP